MKRLPKLTKEQRLKVILDIVKRLKRIPANNDLGYIDVYKEEYPAMKKLMVVFNDYISISQEELEEMSGKIYFEELNRTILYCLPANTRRQPLFKMEWKK